MEFETYEEGHQRRKRHKYKIMIFLIFIGLLGFLIYSAFGNFSIISNIGNSLIGNTIQNQNTIQTYTKGIKISADLDVPSINLNGNLNKIEIQGGSNSYLYADSGKLYLGDSNNNYLTLSKYNGKISFNQTEIFNLNGEVSDLSLNGNQNYPGSGDSMKVYSDTGFSYNFLQIKKGAYIDKLSYNSTGKITLNDGNEIFSLNGENIVIQDFNGSITVENNRLKLDGYVQKLSINGENSISIS